MGLLLSQQRIDGPTPSDVFARPAQMPQQGFLAASGLLDGIGQQGE
jgi:hypothetical protein